MRLPGGRALLLGLLMGGAAEASLASAWAAPKGGGQAIIKVEAISADRAFDQSGQSYDLLGGRRDGVVSVLTEYGLTDRLTFQGKAEWQSGRDGAQEFDGRGPIEVGARWQVYRGSKTVIALYGGYSQSGETRNAGYAEAGQGERDVEVRLLAGRASGRLFGEAQMARRLRDGLPDETRLDLTLGYHLSPNWTLMGQTFMGAGDRQDAGDRAVWAVSEVGAVRHIGHWSGQAAWRSTLGGRSTPDAHGPVLAIWRRF